MNEGTFEGEMDGLDFEIDSTVDVRKIKTPDQIPDRLNFDQVPENILRSGVIESLISQNDDLMARLTVALRRVGTLEENLTDARGEGDKFKEKYRNLNDQVLILKEQSRILADRARAGDRFTQQENQKLSDLKEQVQVLEIRYAELFASSQQKQAKLEKEIAGSSGFTRRYTKYRQNIRRAAVMMREELNMLRQKRESQDTLLQNLRTNIAETTTYISTQAKEHKTALSDLSLGYEAELTAKRTEISELADKNRALQDRTNDYERLFNDKIKLENDLIIAERKEAELRLQTAVEISDIQKALYRHRNEAKELALQLESQGTELGEKTAAVETLTEDKSKLTEQVETLQLLWRDQQNALEKNVEQKNALQKLNQELSIAVNEYRREIRELKEQVEAEVLKGSEAEKAAAVALKAATQASKSNGANGSTQVRAEDRLTPDIISKIDKVLTDLHVGR